VRLRDEVPALREEVKRLEGELSRLQAVVELYTAPVHDVTTTDHEGLQDEVRRVSLELGEVRIGLDAALSTVQEWSTYAGGLEQAKDTLTQELEKATAEAAGKEGLQKECDSLRQLAALSERTLGELRDQLSAAQAVSQQRPPALPSTPGARREGFLHGASPAQPPIMPSPVVPYGDAEADAKLTEELQTRVQELEEQVEDGELEKRMLTGRCSDLERKVAALSSAVGEDGVPALQEVLANADRDRRALEDRVAQLEEEAAEAGPSSPKADVALNGQLEQAYERIIEWREYAESIDEENQRLRANAERLEEAEVQRVLAKGGNGPRERNPDRSRPTRPDGGEGPGANGSDDLLEKLQAKSEAKDRATAKVNELAKQLAAQLETVTKENKGLVARLSEQDNLLDALNKVLDNVAAACRQGIQQSQVNHAVQEHWRTASDLSIVMHQVLSAISSTRRSVHEGSAIMNGVAEALTPARPTRGPTLGIPASLGLPRDDTCRIQGPYGVAGQTAVNRTIVGATQLSRQVAGMGVVGGTTHISQQPVGASSSVMGATQLSRQIAAGAQLARRSAPRQNPHTQSAEVASKLAEDMNAATQGTR